MGRHGAGRLRRPPRHPPPEWLQEALELLEGEPYPELARFVGQIGRIEERRPDGTRIVRFGRHRVEIAPDVYVETADLVD